MPDCVYPTVAARFWACAPDIDHSSSTVASKSVGSPAARQIGTPDLCLCQPLICPPVPPRNPSPADRRWQVEVALGCPWPPLHSGSTWDWIRPDQARLTLRLCVSGSQKKLPGIRKAFGGDFYFSNGECNESHHTLFDVQTFSDLNRSTFCCRNMLTLLKNTSRAEFYPLLRSNDSLQWIFNIYPG